MMQPKMSKPALQKAETEWNTPHFRAVRKPYAGQNRAVRIKAPTASTLKLPTSTVFCSRTMPFMSETLRAWAITSRCFRPMRRRRKKITRVAADMKPKPPISIRHRITVCPKPLHCTQVSYSTRPVTQVAEVAVNSAGRKPQETPLREAAGRVSKHAPSRMIAAKVTAMILVGLMLLGRFFIHRV